MSRPWTARSVVSGAHRFLIASALVGVGTGFE
jgi:hypothetical protein